MDNSKVPIELSPYNAMSILAFCREFVNDETSSDYKFSALREAVDALEEQLGRKMTDDHFEELRIENELNQMIGKSPERK